MKESSTPGWLAMAFFLIAGGVTLPYVVLAPPFHAPDEPSHFLGHIEYMPGTSVLQSSALMLARRGHFEEIHGKPLRKFSFENTRNASSADWSLKITATKMQTRSTTTHRVWRMFTELFPQGDASVLLTKVRGFHTLLFALSMALLIGVSVCFGYSDFAIGFLGLAILAVPSLSFFAMHMSNYGLLTSSYCLGVGVLVALSGITTRSSLKWVVGAGFFAGFMAFFPMLFASTGISFAIYPTVFLVLALGTMWLTGIHHRAALLLSFVGGLGFFYILFRGDMAPSLALLTAAVQDPMHEQSVTWLVYGLGCLLVTCPLCWVITRPHRWEIIARGPKRWISSIWFHAPSINLILTVIWMLLPFFVDAPQLTNIESDRELSMRRYTWDVVRLFFLNFSSSGTDLYLTATFWSGFGWLEKMYDGTTMLFVKLAPLLLLLVGSFLQYRKRQSVGSEQRFLGVYVWGVLTASTGALVFLALAYFSASVNVHGRYLIGVYLMMLACFALQLGDGLGGKESRRIFLLVAYLVMILSKGYSYWFLVGRYLS